MTVKEWLNRGRKLNEEVNELMEARQKALTLACVGAVDTSNEKVQTSSGNVTERKFIAYADYTKLIDDKVDILVNHRSTVLRAINEVDNTTYRTLLIARYINCKTWEQVAEDMGFKDVRHVYRLHGIILEKYNDVIVCHVKSVI